MKNIITQMRMLLIVVVEELIILNRKTDILHPFLNRISLYEVEYNEENCIGIVSILLMICSLIIMWLMISATIILLG